MRIAITGASGLIGTALSRSLNDDGHEVLHLVRRPARNAGEVTWNPVGGEVDTSRLAGVDAVVHLGGVPLGPTRWTASYKHKIRQSRIRGTRTLAEALAGMEQPPPRLLSGSAVGFYGDTGDQPTTEGSPQGTGFLAELATDWESATKSAEDAGISVAHLRTGPVLARSGGLFGMVLPLFRLGLGGKLGDGQQYMSWIALSDHVGATRFLLRNPGIAGPVNLTAPDPVTNATYTAAIGQVLGRPTVLPVPAFAMRAALGGFADEAALVSQRVLPRRLEEAGYVFRHPTVRHALDRILGA